MIELVFPAPRLSALRSALAHPTLESAAILLAAPVPRPGGGHRLLVREIFVPPPEAYEKRTPMDVTLSPAFGLHAEKLAKNRGWSLVYCHTHPHQSPPIFSRVDDLSEVALAGYASMRSPSAPHVALLLGKTGVVARVLGTSVPVAVSEIGSRIQRAYDPADDKLALELAHDRQILAFGEEGQRRLQRTRVAIVGLGGTGSVVAQQLAHLGIDHFLLIDPDIVDATNLNRVVGALPSDVGKTAKVTVAERMIKALRPGAIVETRIADVLSPDVGRELTNVDYVFSCTDSHGSRHLINQVAYQYLVPAFDMGVSISRADGADDLALWAHACMLTPGRPCLWCAGHLDSNQVRRDLMTGAQRRADPYFNQPGSGVAQPAVISLTSTAASLAVTMFLSAAVGIPAPARHLTYDAGRGRAAPLEVSAITGCHYCGDAGIAMGDEIPLPERRDD